MTTKKSFSLYNQGTLHSIKAPIKATEKNKEEDLVQAKGEIKKKMTCIKDKILFYL